ncbi:MAG TPA: hypothetical protein VH164_10005, partial [Ktedonobacteraceae bacterium]|nr:hypothetical protein [Ktedonobacteraceae bacterium]
YPNRVNNTSFMANAEYLMLEHVYPLFVTYTKRKYALLVLLKFGKKSNYTDGGNEGRSVVRFS